MIEVGLGAQEVLEAGGRGTVAAVFSKAAYLRLPAGLVALCTAEVPSGPIHARGPFPILRLAAGEAVTVDGSVAGVDLAGARVWRGELPDMATVDPSIFARAPASALAAYPERAARAAEHLAGGDLAGVVGALSGLGPGLTPAGDDALAGILLVAGSHDRAAAIDAAARARTNDIARAFLAWAARGQSIEPVHRLLVAADRQQAESAVADLLRFGHSSGADLLFGLRLALGVRIATPA
ncbi:MAG TPA: DUF2877 domain-containing protein [Acidimicrobiales bacterium]|nr:DUF2877 domain-containing protein [Acidimicrobiales bacterium]